MRIILDMQENALWLLRMYVLDSPFPFRLLPIAFHGHPKCSLVEIENTAKLKTLLVDRRYCKEEEL